LFLVPLKLSPYYFPKRPVGAVCHRIQPKGYIQWQVQVPCLCINISETIVQQPAGQEFRRGFHISASSNKQRTTTDNYGFADISNTTTFETTQQAEA
jgi:hypothetical protein